MRDHHENFDRESGSVPQSTPRTDSPSYPYGGAYSPPQNTSSPNPQSYTWNAQTGEYHSGPHTPQAYRPVYTPQPTPPRKTRSTPFGVKLLAVFLCCAVTSVATLGAFVWMIQSGRVRIQAAEQDGGAAFTINRVVEAEPEAEMGAVSVMTDQDIAEQVVPSVVCIQNYQINDYYGFMQTSSRVAPAGEGSGIVMDAEGYILTNAHVVDGATSLKVVLYDGSSHEAELIGSDSLTDLAVIRIHTDSLQGTELTPASFGSSADLRVADKVIAIGNPGGSAFSSSVTIGYVSALNRAIPNQTTGYTMEYIQTDAAINPGNSGGALVNQYGQVIGINSAKIAATGYEGLGFAIPSDFAQTIVSDLIRYGYVKDRAMLGISGQFIDSLTGRFYGLPQGEYVATLNTAHAVASGLREGDVILSMNGTELTSEAVMRRMIHAGKPGDIMQLEVYRPSTRETLEIALTLSEYTGG
ncbi:MAG: trypsin-like peptidase domain-containing protein [Clostridia bacterium]|nr:trypsin-like peptidase domain-containing protein [Clostridia bacterium]